MYNLSGVKSMVCRLFELAYEDLEKTGGRCESAVDLFESGEYKHWAEFIDATPEELYRAYQERCKKCPCRQLEFNFLDTV